MRFFVKVEQSAPFSGYSYRSYSGISQAEIEAELAGQTYTFITEAEYNTATAG